MTQGTIEKMEALILEFQNQIDTDRGDNWKVGQEIWTEAKHALERAVAYQRRKQEAAMRKAYRDTPTNAKFV